MRNGTGWDVGNLKLSFACALYEPHGAAVYGRSEAGWHDPELHAIEEPRPIFDRMSGGQEFEVAEYSSSEFVQRFANKQCPFVALPVFPSRCFRHGSLRSTRNPESRRPRIWKANRWVPLYTMTAAIFHQGALQHEYGVDCEKIQWVQGAVNHAGSHGDPHVLPLSRSKSSKAPKAGRSTI